MSSEKKILFLSLRSFSLTGGIENVCKSIAYHFYRLHQSRAVDFKMISLYDDFPNPKYIDPLLFKGYRGKKVMGFYKSIQTGLQQDLVILSHINLAPIGLAIKLLRPKTKLVLWTHGIEVWRPFNAIKKTFLKRVDQIVAVSRFTANSLNEWHQVDLKKVQVIPNALDPFYKFPELKDQEGPIRKKYGLKTGIPVFMALCRIKASEKNKNYDLVIRTLAALKKEGHPSYYLLCGKYEEGESLRLKKLAIAVNFEPELIMPGYLPEQEVVEIQQAANAFVLPSEKEGFGLVFIEAQAAGLRVIAGNKDGSGEAIRNPAAGQLVNPTDEAELKAALLKLMQKELKTEERNMIKEACKQDFGFERFATALAGLR